MVLLRLRRGRTIVVAVIQYFYNATDWLPGFYSMAYIKINKDRCKGCYFCIEFCPRDLIVISKTHNKLGYFPAEFDMINEDRCTGCKTCAIVCPDTAIEVYK